MKVIKDTNKTGDITINNSKLDNNTYELNVSCIILIIVSNKNTIKIVNQNTFDVFIVTPDEILFIIHSDIHIDGIIDIRLI
ncbi:MAG: hypothetical protein ORN26_02775 [Candidatus Pacebacteria bacterium]|nr:hypothetical protein [Candidatus Paceibacterota bacterium]